MQEGAGMAGAETVASGGTANISIAPVAATTATAAQVEVKAPTRRTKVAIVGFADSWPEAPFSNDDWEIWCCNQFYSLCGDRINLADIAKEGRLRWFEIHARHDLETDLNVVRRNRDHLQKLAVMKCPVYMHRHWDDIPGSVEYPLKVVRDRFGSYLTNSISYMIAIAILERFQDIGIYGVNLAMDQEYGDQRPSCEFFCGWAAGAGARVHIPVQSDLLKAPYLYGYEDHKRDGMLAKLDQLNAEHGQKMAGLKQQAEAAEAQFQQFHGAQQQLVAIKRYFKIGC